MKPVRIPFGCIPSYASPTSVISAVSEKNSKTNSEFILFVIHKMEKLTYPVQTRPAVCVCALLGFLVACTCSLFFNASENSSPRMLIVLDSILFLRWMRI